MLEGACSRGPGGAVGLWTGLLRIMSGFTVGAELGNQRPDLRLGDGARVLGFPCPDLGEGGLSVLPPGFMTFGTGLIQLSA